MKTWGYILIAFTLVCSQSARAAEEEDSLSSALESLNSPANQAPGVVTEKMYTVQDRYTPLKNRVETSALFGQKLNDTGFIQSREVGVGIRYHISSKWSLGLHGSYTFNQFTGTADRLYKAEGLIPDVPYVKYRGDLSARYNLFYGKFRVSMDKVLYFDHYVSAGPAVVAVTGLSNQTQNQFGGAVDTGLAFWMGQNWTANFGLKDYIYPEGKGGGLSNQLLVYLEFGYLFGKGV